MVIQNKFLQSIEKKQSLTNKKRNKLYNAATIAPKIANAPAVEKRAATLSNTVKFDPESELPVTMGSSAVVTSVAPVGSVNDGSFGDVTSDGMSVEFETFVVLANKEAESDGVYV